MEQIEKRLTERRNRLAGLQGLDLSYKNLDEYDEKIRSAASMSEAKSKYNEKLRIEGEFKEKEELAQKMSDKLQSLIEEKSKMMDDAKLPVDGLDFSNGDVSYNGIEFSQINTAEKIRISMAMAMALNPRLRIVRIMNGSLIDTDGMKQVEEMARDKGFDIWIERVSEEKTSDNSFLITEGELNE